MYGWLPPLSRGYFVEGSYYLDILSVTVFAPDPMLTRGEVRILHHCVTVGTPAGKRMDDYLPLFRHDGIPSMSFFSHLDPAVRTLRRSTRRWRGRSGSVSYGKLLYLNITNRLRELHPISFFIVILWFLIRYVFYSTLYPQFRSRL